MALNVETLKQYSHIYVIGHKKPDTDTIISSKILADILSDSGIQSDYAVLENELPDDYNMNMIRDCLKYRPKIIRIEDISKGKYFLVDHNDVSQSIGDKNLVVGCIDHHINSGTIDNAILTDYCCTAIYIYEMFKDKYDFSDEQKRQIYMAFLNDSTFGKSSRYKETDEVLAKELGFNESYDELFKRYFIPTDLSQGLEVAFEKNGHKSYVFENFEFESGYIEALGTNGLDKYRDFVGKYEGNFLGLWVDYMENKTYTYLKYNSELTERTYGFIASRATTVMEDVLEYLNAKYGSQKIKKGNHSY